MYLGRKKSLDCPVSILESHFKWLLDLTPEQGDLSVLKFPGAGYVTERDGHPYMSTTL